MEQGPTFIIYSVFLLISLCVILLRWGKRTPGHGSLLAALGVMGLLAAIGFDSNILLRQPFQIKLWQVGWIWPKSEVGAITVGVSQDPLSLIITALGAVIAGTFLISKELLGKESYPNRSYAALILSAAGVAISWSSMTPWLSFFGIMLTIGGGFISLSSRWDINREANVAAKFVWERSLGLLLAFFGACILTTVQSPLILSQSDEWMTHAISVGGPTSLATWIGSALLVIGLFVQMQPFPLVGWLVTSSEVALPLRILLNQIFPAWAAFSLMIRFEPELLKLGFFPGFGWIALISSLLVLCLGLFQNQWRLGLSIWLAAAFSLSCALLAFSGPLVGMAFLIGVSLGGLGLSCGALAMDRKSAESSSSNRQIWTKISSFLSIAAGTGVIGFVSATGGIRWIAGATHEPGTLALYLFVYFVFALLGWKLLWWGLKEQKKSDVSWSTLFSISIWILLSLGVLWTGTITGEVLLGNPDIVTFSLFKEFFEPNSGPFENATDFLSASSFYWGALILAFAGAYWTAGRDEDKWDLLFKSFPRVTQFIVYGYGIEPLSIRIEKAVIWIGSTSEKLVDDKIWSNWIPDGLHFGLRTLSTWVSQFDLRLSSWIEEGLRKWVEIPGKTLQLIQTGDVRWYLFFALGSGFALLFHFLPSL